MLIRAMMLPLTDIEVDLVLYSKKISLTIIFSFTFSISYGVPRIHSNPYSPIHWQKLLDT
ncbi:hypothetical protein Lalb_Chr18g0052331 [Lupinus albus]|uniref:Uncharacterized protein n=1 Tax=Lupinus albus TaxID=3870 RepID=A0A6A4P3V7_LUPAL|nr:hypothetical protein Lalb_Chr18g0052331 [Lupinus albus]